MSFPNIPNVTSDINLDGKGTDLLLSAIAFQELGLSHIINAEAEKIQYALGTLERKPKARASINEVLAVNNSVSKMLRNVIKEQMLLQGSLEDIVCTTGKQIHRNVATVTARYNGLQLTATDVAYYYTKRGGKVV